MRVLVSVPCEGAGVRCSPPAGVICDDVEGALHRLPGMHKVHLLCPTLSEDTIYCEPAESGCVTQT